MGSTWHCPFGCVKHLLAAFCLARGYLRLFFKEFLLHYNSLCDKPRDVTEREREREILREGLLICEMHSKGSPARFTVGQLGLTRTLNSSQAGTGSKEAMNGEEHYGSLEDTRGLFHTPC